jgi:TatD DNase family protein
MIDTHCHLIDPQFNRDLDAVLERAQKVGITSIINAGYDVKTSTEAITMSKQLRWLKPAIGIHPNEAAAELINEMQSIEALLRCDFICAIGETGLDYYRDFSPRDAQKELFRKHIDLARKYHLPLLIHTRRSIDDAIIILKEENYHCGVFHCYSGSYEQAKIVIDMGYYVGFGGLLTFSKRLHEIFKKLPTDRILLETDAPFLAPEGHRGQRNEPSYIIETLASAAHMLHVPPRRLEEIVDHNATTLFSL